MTVPPKQTASPSSPLNRQSIWVTGVKTFVLVLVLLFCACGAQATISYSISIANPDAHLFHVTISVPDVHDQFEVQMPAWNATYQIRDFASRIQDFRAVDERGESLTAKKVDKQTWRIMGQGKLTATYAIFWDEPGPFSSQLNSSHAFMNLAEVLVYAPGRRSEAIEIGFEDLPKGWEVVTRQAECILLRSGAVQKIACLAPNYDALVDAPVEIGAFQHFDLEGITPPVHVAVHANNFDQGRLAKDLSKIVRYETMLMGGAPYDNYTFIIHIGGEGGGGMEHANSTAISAGSVDGVIDVAAHEFFHLWNVKRIRPQTLEPVDYTREMYTRALWFAEGVTSTYGAYTLLRTGLWNHGQFFGDIAQQITELQSRPAHIWESVEESSLDAWLEKYPQHNRPEYSISYYNKGQLIGLLLDILIRDATDNRKSLDDVLRALNDNFARKGRFYNDSADIEATVESIAGTSFKDFFARYVAGTDEVPFGEVLAKAGLDLKPTSAQRADFGFETSSSFAGTSIIVTSVTAGSPAQQAGIRSGDVLISLNGESIQRGLGSWLQQHNPGDSVRMHLRRQGHELDISFKLGAQSVQEYRLDELKGANEKQRRIREGLLKGTTN
ncbi:MAG TPA: PDZ domain-containing protein [Candidatus Acidoferrales bacterium]|nr:PDZ domain-containing protein [Candidatus Acidoferrales bacterium]